jgi:hypothetical protein
MTKPMRATTARAIKIHGSAELDPLEGVLVGEGAADVSSAAGEGDGDGDGEMDGGAVVTSGVGGALVAGRVGRLGGETVMPWLAATLAIASLAAPPHPATRKAAAKIPAARISEPRHLRLDIVPIFWPPASAGFPRHG